MGFGRADLLLAGVAIDERTYLYDCPHPPPTGVPVVPVLIPLVIDLAQGNAPSNDLIIRRDEL